MTFENIAVDSSDISRLETTLNNTKLPLSQRFRALFTLKSINTASSIKAIESAFSESGSTLLNHELAYVLGQMKNPLAVPMLESILTSNHAVMTRHEAAEALGAISSIESLELLQKHCLKEFESEEVVRETCELAVAKILHDQSDETVQQG